MQNKYSKELKFWEGYIKTNGKIPETEYYQKFMMDMGDISNVEFFNGLICLDVGCGPMGSLTWLKNAKLVVGLDPLSNHYMKFGIRDHNMLYLAAYVENIPLPTHYIDVVFSMNSLDHVDNVIEACKEIRRVLKPDGYFIGSLNLEESPTLTEPFTLTEKFLNKYLFYKWEKEFYKIRPRVHDNRHFGPYRFFYEQCPAELMDAPGPKVLWCRFRT